MNKDITNYNVKGRLYGYRERYWGNGNLLYKGFYNNGVKIDYREYHSHNGKKLLKSFYI